MPKVSIICVSYNRRDLLLKCLRSCVIQDYSDLEILALINGSEDGSAATVRNELPQVRILETHRNLGFFPALNIAIANTGGDYLMMMDDDAYFLDPDAISKLLSASLSGSNRIQLDPPNSTGNSQASATNTRQEDSSITASVSVTPNGMWPTMNFTHTQGRNNLTGGNAYTLFNVTKEFDGWRLFGNFTRIQNGQFFNAGTTGPEALIPPSVNVTLGAMLKLNDSNTLQASQSFGSGGSLGGGATLASDRAAKDKSEPS